MRAAFFFFTYWYKLSKVSFPMVYVKKGTINFIIYTIANNCYRWMLLCFGLFLFLSLFLLWFLSTDVFSFALSAQVLVSLNPRILELAFFFFFWELFEFHETSWCIFRLDAAILMTLGKSSTLLKCYKQRNTMYCYYYFIQIKKKLFFINQIPIFLYI